MKESKKINEFLKYFVSNNTTRKNYMSRLMIYYRAVDRYPDAYMDSVEEHKQDLKNFLDSEYCKNATKLTVKSTLNAVIQLIQSNDVILPKSFKNMASIYTRNAKPITQDRILEKKQLKNVILSGDTIERAMFSMISSSGMRINEFSLLEKTDIEFKTKPVTVHIRSETAKGNKERWCFIDKIASDYLKKYLDKRDHYLKKLDKYNYKREVDKNLLFPITSHAIRRKWEKLLRRNNLSEKDVNTGREIYHIHTLRKFFITNMKLHMPEAILNSIIGHSSYLGGSYERYTVEQLRDAYKSCEGFISFESRTVDKKELNGKMKEKDIEIKLITRGQEKQQEEMDKYEQQIKRQQETIDALANRISDLVDASQKAGLSKWVKQKEQPEEEQEKQ